jgi:N-acetylglutamate synthase-like GNAT family acetyltransferase
MRNSRDAATVRVDTVGSQDLGISRKTVMVGSEAPVIFRSYQTSDFDQVAALWSRINRELAPAGMEELFEQYIATTISGELAHLPEVFSERQRNAFWVVESQDGVVGCFGIECGSETNTELRRMYLDRWYRGSGVSNRMLDFAEERARALGFTKMLVSTAEIQRAADRFYRRNGYRQVRVEVAQTMTTKQAGGGLTRFYFEKEL